MSGTDRGMLIDTLKDDIAHEGIPKESIAVALSTGSIVATATFAASVRYQLLLSELRSRNHPNCPIICVLRFWVKSERRDCGVTPGFH